MTKNKVFHTDFLFANPSFIVGAGSIFNIAGNYFDYNYSHSTDEADAKAIRSDWGMIGQDMFEVIEHTPIDEINEQKTSVKTK